MKKSANTTIDSNYSQENKLTFFTTSNRFFSFKSDFMTVCSQITFLFQEKLPIIYANIRV